MAMGNARKQEKTAIAFSTNWRLLSDAIVTMFGSADEAFGSQGGRVTLFRLTQIGRVCVYSRPKNPVSFKLRRYNNVIK